MASKRSNSEVLPVRCMFGKKCYSKNPVHFSKYCHPHLEEEYDPEECSKMPKTSREVIKCQRKIIMGLGGCRTSSPNSSPSKRKKSSPETSGEKASFDKPAKPIAYDVGTKLASGVPMNLFYNKVKDSAETHNDLQSLYFSDLLHPSLGSIKSTLQITFLAELDWLMMNYEITRNETKPLTLLCGQLASFEDEDGCDLTEKYPNIKHKVVKSPYPFGTHHTKIMVLLYDDDSVRVVVLTSNLIADDWLNRTQGLWVSPKCRKMSKTVGDGDSTTKFKSSLVRYLNQYESPSLLSPFTNAIVESDMSEINAFFVGSVPGSHDVVEHHEKNYGQSSVNRILCDHADEASRDWAVIMQCSSIGSLGKQYAGSFLQELALSLNGCPGSVGTPKEIRFVYPTMNDVAEAFGGPAYGGGCLPYGQETHERQKWLKDFMYKWRSDRIHRTKAVPHIKSYTKINATNDEAAFYMMTSSNLSKAAWGSLSKKGGKKLFIMSYEAGILLLPKFTHGKATYELGKDLVLPFDLPLTKYDLSSDEPFYHPSRFKNIFKT